MRSRRLTILTATMLVASMLVVSTGALSSGDLERGVSVGVSDDETGVLRVEAVDLELTGSASGVELLTLGNQFATDLSYVDVTVSESDETTGLSLSNISDVTTLDSGESVSVTADVDCGGNASTETITFDIVGSGGNVEVDLEREIVISCTV